MIAGRKPLIRRPGARVSGAGPFSFSAVLVAAAVAVAAILPPAGRTEAAEPPRSPARPNVLLLTVDTLRPDALGWVAGTNPTPELDALAEGGFRFPAAVSPAPLTLPTHASILTGLLPRRHGLRDNGQVLPAAGPRTLAEELGERGWATAAFVSGFPLAAEFGLDRGFGRYDDELTAGRGDRLERPAAATVAAALAWAEEAPEPWFLWVHLYDPHDPYEPPAGLARPGPHGAYYGEVVAVDRAVGTLRKALAESAGRTLTVFAADHGESLGEHGEATHGFFIYQSTVEVPLVVHLPGKVEPGESDAAARLIDVAPTVLDLLGLPAWSGVDGVSLAPLLAGRGEPPPPAYVESRRPWLSYGWAPLAAVIDGGWKLIAAPRPELYHLDADPAEQRNRVDEERRRARALQAELRAVEAKPAAEAARQDDPETLGRLRALGYVGAGGADAGEPPPGLPDPKDRIAAWNPLRAAQGLAGPHAGEPPPGLPDPKDRIAAWNLLGEAEALIDRGRFGEAVGKFDRVLADDPGNPFALARSGSALLEAGDPAAALPRLERAVRADPDRPESRRALALALNRLGRNADAALQWMEAVRLQPRDAGAWVNLGGSLGLAGERTRAADAFRRAVELEPEDPDLLIRLGFAEHAAGDPAAAVRRLTRAAELTGPAAFPHSGALGILLTDLDRPADARPWLARSRPGEPDHAEARYRLARILAAAGEREAAARALREALAADPRLRARAAGDTELAPLID